MSKDGDKLIAQVEKLPEDVVLNELKTISETGTLNDKKELTELKRKLVTLTKIVGYKIEKGPKFALEIVNLETDITSDMVLNHTWKDAQFKPYNFNSEGVYPNSGALHPLNKVREEFRQIFSQWDSPKCHQTNTWKQGFGILILYSSLNNILLEIYKILST